MPRINIHLSDQNLELVDEQAKKEGRSRSGHIAELIKEEEKRNKRKADKVWKKMELRQFDREQGNEWIIISPINNNPTTRG